MCHSPVSGGWSPTAAALTGTHWEYAGIRFPRAGQAVLSVDWRPRLFPLEKGQASLVGAELRPIVGKSFGRQVEGRRM